MKGFLSVALAAGALGCTPSSSTTNQQQPIKGDPSATTTSSTPSTPTDDKSVSPAQGATMTTSPASPVSPDEARADADGERAFAAKLYGDLLKKAKGNLFVSPASARFALSMVVAGARGDTAKELAAALGTTPRTHDVAATLANDWAALATPKSKDDWAKTQAVTLRTANRLFGQKGKPFASDYVELTKLRYGAPIEAVDFKTNAAAAQKLINDWVAARTEQRIKDILTQPPPSDTALMLANAIYFKASWVNPFKEGDTKPQPFKSPGAVTAPMMSQEENLSFGETEDAQLVQLDYGGMGARSEVAMVIVVPKKDDGLADIEKKLSADQLAAWARVANTSRPRVMLSMPKFRIESTMSLKETLQGLGVTKAFQFGQADFSGMDGSHDLFIGLALQKTFVAVDEKGTEAAAATIVGMVAGGPPHAPPKPIVVKADHPFLFMIRDTVRDRVLFIGRVVNPT